MTKAQIKHMVDRFLGWKLPDSFNPDGGISFKRTFNDHLPTPMKHQPSGTNLFDATQADAMVRYMLEGMPDLCGRIERRIRELPATPAGGLASSNLGRLLSDEIIKRIAKEAADEAQS